MAGAVHIDIQSSARTEHVKHFILTWSKGICNKFQIWATVCRFNIHSPDLSFCLHRKSAARFKTPGTWTALKERNLSWAQRRRQRACLFRVRDCEPPWRFIWDNTAVLSILTITWHPWVRGESDLVPGRWLSASGSLLARIGTLMNKNSSSHSKCNSDIKTRNQWLDFTVNYLKKNVTHTQILLDTVRRYYQKPFKLCAIYRSALYFSCYLESTDSFWIHTH